MLTACASGLVNHAFSFDARPDSPEVQILNFRYRETKQPSARADESDVRAGKVRQSVGISGDMLRGNSLCVKWRVRETNLLYEDTVNLDRVTPQNIAGHEIYFIVKGDRLFVYLVTPEKRPPEFPVNRPRKYDHLKVITISSNRGREIADAN